MSDFTPESVEHLAQLARIALTEQEKIEMAAQLAKVLDSIEKISEAVDDSIPKTSHPIPLRNVLRSDEEQRSIDRELVLRGAPDADGERFRVSAILGEEQ